MCGAKVVKQDCDFGGCLGSVRGCLLLTKIHSLAFRFVGVEGGKAIGAVLEKNEILQELK